MTDLVVFEDWYGETHQRLLGALALIAGNVDLAADVVDEAFTRALERWPRVGTMESPAAWTYTVALNLLRRTQRRRTLETRLLRRGVRPPTDAPPQIDLELWQAVAELTDRQRTVVVARAVLDMAPASIADALGVRVGTVWATYDAAKRKLAERLGDNDEKERDHANH